MKDYFEKGNLKLHRMDCMELMKGKPDNYYDLCICDPPYGINADSKNSVRESKCKESATLSKDYGDQIWDNNVPTLEYFLELKRVSKDQIIWGVNYYPYSILIGGRIYWDKCVTMPTYSNGELAYCSKLNSIKSVSIAWHGMIQHDMKNKEVRCHPTQKPVQLYKWLLKNYAKHGNKILDTHLGSASSAIAAYYFDCEFEGCELDKDYFRDSIKRVDEQTNQRKLIFNG